MVSKEYVQTADPCDMDLAFLGAWNAIGLTSRGPKVGGSNCFFSPGSAERGVEGRVLALWKGDAGMSHRSRLHVPGGVYYIIQRSKAPQHIFADASDQPLFERLLSGLLVRCRVQALAYCWQTDAIHLVVRVSDVPLGRFMQRLSSQYARRACGRRSGQLFQSRYHALLIDPEVYLLKLVRHVHLVPQRSGQVEQTGYRLTSHLAYTGAASIRWLTSSVALQMLAPQLDQARAAYKRLMLEAPSPEETASFERGGPADPRVLGDAAFTAAIAREQRQQAGSYSLDQIIDSVVNVLGLERSKVLSHSRQRRFSLARAVITWYATERGVATLAEVARRLERDPSTLLVAMDRYRILRPELFNPSALQDAVLGNLTSAARRA
jgi:putative transposase